LIGEETAELIEVETATVFAFTINFRCLKIDALIVPKRLVQNYFNLTLKEQTAC
jgi:diadenosine tetraphosphate (Ap4A) HIT family hydrolase